MLKIFEWVAYDKNGNPDYGNTYKPKAGKVQKHLDNLYRLSRCFYGKSFAIPISRRDFLKPARLTAAGTLLVGAS